MTIEGFEYIFKKYKKNPCCCKVAQRWQTNPIAAKLAPYAKPWIKRIEKNAVIPLEAAKGKNAVEIVERIPADKKTKRAPNFVYNIEKGNVDIILARPTYFF